jgi:hypothetical protein
MDNAVGTDKRNSERKTFNSKIEFIVDADLLAATSVNISDSGIRFNAENPIKVTLRFFLEGENQIKSARLVWAHKEEDGRMSYGLEFVDE